MATTSCDLRPMSPKRRAFNNDSSIRMSVVCAGGRRDFGGDCALGGPGACRRIKHAVGAAPAAVLESVQGPVLKIIAVLIIIVTGLTLAFGDTSGGFRRLIQIVFGLSIAFAASSFFLSFFSFSGGALV